MIALLIALSAPAHAFKPDLESVAEPCWPAAERIQEDISAGRGSYNEQAQQDLLNYFDGHHPLTAALRRSAQGWTRQYRARVGHHSTPRLRSSPCVGEKTEDTNKTPIAPRPRILFQFGTPIDLCWPRLRAASQGVRHAQRHHQR